MSFIFSLLLLGTTLHIRGDQYPNIVYTELDHGTTFIAPRGLSFDTVTIGDPGAWEVQTKKNVVMLIPLDSEREKTTLFLTYADKTITMDIVLNPKKAANMRTLVFHGANGDLFKHTPTTDDKADELAEARAEIQACNDRATEDREKMGKITQEKRRH